MPTPVYLVASPIGDYLGDLSLAAVHTLKNVAHVFLEADDRYAARLREQGLISSRHQVHFLDQPQLEPARELIRAQKPFALLSSCGIPCFLDPGRDIVRACLDDHADEVELVPIGVSSVLDAALCLSGVQAAMFHFNGHYPEKYRFESAPDEIEVPLVYYVRGDALHEFLEELRARVAHVRRVVLLENLRKKGRSRIRVLRDFEREELPPNDASADYACVIERRWPDGRSIPGFDSQWTSD
jgi:16S rRNA (cytidine1402-2'-O)-methyltransferase